MPPGSPVCGGFRGSRGGHAGSGAFRQVLRAEPRIWRFFRASRLLHGLIQPACPPANRLHLHLRAGRFPGRPAWARSGSPRSRGMRPTSSPARSSTASPPMSTRSRPRLTGSARRSRPPDVRRQAGRVAEGRQFPRRHGDRQGRDDAQAASRTSSGSWRRSTRGDGRPHHGGAGGPPALLCKVVREGATLPSPAAARTPRPWRPWSWRRPGPRRDDRAGRPQLLLAKVGANARLLVEEVRKLATVMRRPRDRRGRRRRTDAQRRRGRLLRDGRRFFLRRPPPGPGRPQPAFFRRRRRPAVLAALQNRNRILLQVRALARLGRGPGRAEGRRRAAGRGPATRPSSARPRGEELL